MGFNITNRSQLLKGIKQAVINQALPQIAPGVAEILEEDLKKRLLREFGETEVIEGILGKYAGDENKDLQAIFGLSESMAAEAVDQMINAVDDVLTVTYDINDVTRNKTSFSFQINIGDIGAAIANIPAGSYQTVYKDVRFSGKNRFDVAKPITINWMDWLLNGGETEAGIEFDPVNDRIATAIKESRSGRAVMVRSYTEGWDYSPSTNFITDIVNPRFEKDAAQDFQKRLQEAVKRRNIRIG